MSFDEKNAVIRSCASCLIEFRKSSLYLLFKMDRQVYQLTHNGEKVTVSGRGRKQKFASADPLNLGGQESQRRGRISCIGYFKTPATSFKVNIWSV